MPAAVAACRVCLAMDARLFTIAGSLQLVYERITNNALRTADGRPVAACYICYAQLNKCRKLLRTSVQAENVLNAIVHRQSEITERSISEVDREALGLCGSLGRCHAAFDETDAQDTTVVEIKTEPQWELAITDVRTEVDYGICKTESCSDEDRGRLTLSTEQGGLEEDVAPAQTLGSVELKQVESTTDRTQLESPDQAPGPHQCDVCQRDFKYPSRLTNHYRTHTGEKPFQCDVCHRCFSFNHHLIQHMRTHTGEKPYQCNICDHSFNDKSSLSKHTRTHTGEKPFQCDVCDRCFNVKINLSNHMRTHTGEKPYQCSICDRSFNKKSTLIRHLRTHTGETPFHCDVCDKGFKQKYSLVEHLRNHSGDKPFQCEVCPKAFIKKRYLLRHTKIHARNKPA